jgi:hypothetical protein
MKIPGVRTTAAALALLAALAPDSTAQILVTSPTVMEHTAHAGERYTGTIDVLNTTSTSQTVTVQVVDYSFQADGTNRYDEPGSQPRSNARWLTLGTRSLEIPAQQRTSLDYAVQVPAGDGLRGSYASLVLVSSSPRAARPTTIHGRASAGVSTKLSFGVQVVTQLAGNAETRLGLEQLATTAQERTIALTVRNTGERAQRPLLSLELYREDGQLVTTRTAQRGLIYPGSSVRQVFTLAGVPAGKYRALIQAVAGEDDVFALQSDVRF